MPYKDTAESKKYNRERMKLSRERAKEAAGAIKAEGGASAARVTPPILVKPEGSLPSGQPPAAQPAPTIPATPQTYDPAASKERMARRWQEMKAEREGKPQYTHRSKDEIQAQRETSGSTSAALATETNSVQAEPPIQTSLDKALKLLRGQGWCLWSCNTWSDDVVCILRDRNVEGFPPGYPLAELKKRADGFLELYLIPGEMLKPQVRLIN